MAKGLIWFFQGLCFITIIVLIRLGYKNIELHYFWNFSFQEILTLLLVILNIFLLIQIYSVFVEKLTEKQKQTEFICSQLNEIILILDKEILYYLPDNTSNSRKKLLTYQRKLKKCIALLKKIVPSSLNTYIEAIETHFDSYYTCSGEYNNSFETFNSHTQDYLRDLNLIEHSCLELQAKLLGFEI